MQHTRLGINSAFVVHPFWFVCILRQDYDPDRAYFCPVCHKQDDGSPMVGCDGCDEWCHWYVKDRSYLN